MKAGRIILLFCISFGCTPTPQGGLKGTGSIEDEIIARPDRAACERYLYQEPSSRLTPAPGGYKAFYISHYGRHGSRANIKSTAVDAVLAALEPASEAGLLTPKGDSLLADARLEASLADGMYGFLTGKGVEQHRAIGRRLVERFPSVFRRNARVNCVSSPFPRCVLSMGACVASISAVRPSVEIRMDAGDRYRSYLLLESSDKMKAGHDSLMRMVPAVADSLSLASSIFRDLRPARALVPSLEAFSRNLYAVAAMSQNLDGAPDFWHYLGRTEIMYNFIRENRNIYISTCNSAELGKYRMPLVRPLVRDIVDKADAAVAGNGPSADLRFGHDFVLCTLLNAFGVETVKQGLSFCEIDGAFRSWEVTPMAANIQLVFYRNRAGRVLVKCLHNEEEVRLANLPDSEAPYYLWEDLKKQLMAI